MPIDTEPAATAVIPEIAADPRGSNGFGYDPIFFYPPYGKTLGEATDEEKLVVSHRGQAFRAFARWMDSSGFPRERQQRTAERHVDVADRRRFEGEQT